MKVSMGTVRYYVWTRDDWLIKPDCWEEEVFINWRDWRCTALWFGKRMEFQMVHRPKGIYALPVKPCSQDESDLKKA
ncbi:hypothetical protein FHP26_04305 [Pseudomonas orientalis]|nr:hypothetical protein [Pseudomonas orientalis]